MNESNLYLAISIQQPTRSKHKNLMKIEKMQKLLEDNISKYNQLSKKFKASLRPKTSKGEKANSKRAQQNLLEIGYPPLTVKKQEKEESYKIEEHIIEKVEKVSKTP